MTRVLELGSYILPAYAGMILAEQGFEVTKWTNPAGDFDPILGLRRVTSCGPGSTTANP